VLVGLFIVAMAVIVGAIAVYNEKNATKVLVVAWIIEFTIAFCATLVP